MHFLPKNLECFCSWCFGKRVERFLNLCTHKPSNIPLLVWISQIVEVIAQKRHKRETKGSVWGSFPALWFVSCLSAFPHDSKFIGVTNHLKAGYPMLLASGLPWALGTVQAGLVGWGVKGEGGQQVPLCHCLLFCHPPWPLRTQMLRPPLASGLLTAGFLPSLSSLSPSPMSWIAPSSLKCHHALLTQKSTPVWKLIAGGKLPWCGGSLQYPTSSTPRLSLRHGRGSLTDQIEMLKSPSLWNQLKTYHEKQWEIDGVVNTCRIGQLESQRTDHTSRFLESWAR